MEIIFSAKRTKISDSFKQTVEKKFDRFERKVPDLDYIRINVTHQNNPSRAAKSEKVEITIARTSGEFIRTEAYEATKMNAFDLAFERLSKRVRRDNDRRKSQKRNGVKAEFVLPEDLYVSVMQEAGSDAKSEVPEREPLKEDDEFYLGDSSVIVKKKIHKDKPMTLDDAIYKMEMIDHDFYIYVDSESGRPAVVYRRHGYTYGVLELDNEA